MAVFLHAVFYMHLGFCFLLKISPKFVVPRGTFDNMSSLIQVMARYLMSQWWLSSLADLFVTRPQWVSTPDSKVHGANMGLIWGRQDPGGPHVGPMNFAIWDWHLLSLHCSDVVMSPMSTRITGVWIVCSTVCSGANQRKHPPPHHWPLWGESTGDRRIPLTNDQ